MVLKEEKDRIRTLISETLTLMCKNGLNYKAEFSIDALVGITLDQKEEFFLSIKDGFSFRPVIEEDNGIPQTPKKNNYSQRQESVDEPPSPIKDVEGEENEHEAKSSRRKRKRRRSSEAYSDNPGDQAANGGEEANKANNKPEIITNFSLQDLQQLHDNAADELWTSITGEGEENASSSPSQRGANASCSEPAAAVKKPHVDDETSYSSMSETGGRTPVTPASVKQESYAQEEDDEESEVLYIKDEPESDDNDASNDQAYGAKHYPIDSSPRGHASSSFMPPHHITPAAHHSSFNASAWNPALSMQQNTPGNISRQANWGNMRSPAGQMGSARAPHYSTQAYVAPTTTRHPSHMAVPHQQSPMADPTQRGVGAPHIQRGGIIVDPPRQRSSNWTHSETMALLTMLCEDDVRHGLRMERNHANVYQQLGHRLADGSGNQRTAAQVQIRLQNLRQMYKNLAKQPLEKRQCWKYYDMMEQCYRSDCFGRGFPVTQSPQPSPHHSQQFTGPPNMSGP